MNLLRTKLAGLMIAALAFGPLSSRADDLPATLSDIHDVLIKAAGDDDATPPPNQRELLAQALKMIRTAPPEDGRPLRVATHDINVALAEIAKGNPTHHARTDILDAADIIKTLMD